MSGIISPTEKLVMLLHLVRCPDILDKAKSGLTLDCFTEEREERYYKLIYGMVLSNLECSGTTITKLKLQALIDQFIQTAKELFSEQDRLQIFNILDQIFDLPEEHLDKSFAVKILQNFITERQALPPLREVVDSIDGLGVDQLDKVLSKLDRIRQNITMHSCAPVNILKPESFVFDTRPRFSTGVSIFDTLMGGGAKRGETYGIVGPTGGGKTLLALMLCRGYSLRKKYCMYLSYEQRLDQIAPRLYSCVTGESISYFDGKTMSDLPPSIREKLINYGDKCGDYLLAYDMTGITAGYGGFDEIKALYSDCVNRGKKPEAIIVDWRWQAVTNELSAKNKDPSVIRQELQIFNNKCVHFAQKEDINMWILEQLRNECNSRSPMVKPQVGDVQEDRSFAQLLAGCFLIGTHNKENRIAWLVADKFRGLGSPYMLVKINKEHQVIEDVTSKYSVSEFSSDFISNDEAAGLVEDSGLPTQSKLANLRFGSN